MGVVYPFKESTANCFCRYNSSNVYELSVDFDKVLLIPQIWFHLNKTMIKICIVIIFVWIYTYGLQIRYCIQENENDLINCDMMIPVLCTSLFFEETHTNTQSHSQINT